MTIKFDSYTDMGNFFKKCLFIGDCPDNRLPVFSDVQADFNFKEVALGGKTVPEVNKILKAHNIKVKWVGEY